MTYCPLDLVENYLRRFVAYPSEQALAAHVLWIAHTHLIECFDTTPRLGFMSAEKESVFGTAKAQEANAELCSFLNSGYWRGAKAYRCTSNGKKMEPEEFDSFAPVAVAGLRDLPDTLASRCIFIRMKRRAPDEQVESFRIRYHAPEAKAIKEALEQWCAAHDVTGAEPTLPDGIQDRAADCWEPLLAIADKAGSDWPVRARTAVYLTSRTADESLTKGVELLAHIREAFGSEDKIWTSTLCERLCERDESPWKDIRGKSLDDRGLSARLKQYGIKSKDVRLGDKAKKGYHAADFYDAWARYLPKRDKSDKRDIFDNENNFVADVADVAAEMEVQFAYDDATVAFEERAASLQYEGGLSARTQKQ